MSGVNKVILVGRLGQDPELREFDSGSKLCKFSVATSKPVKGQDKTEWHNVVVWSRPESGLAEACARILAKGKQVYIEGELESSKKDDKTYWQVNARSVQFLGDGGKEGAVPNFAPGS